MAIKIEMLRAFSAVAQTGNLAEAAERLGRTPSAVSMTLKQLESHLGHSLFEGERKNRLTLLGEQVFDMSRPQLRRFDDTIRSIEASAKAPKGLIRAVAVPSVASRVFPPAIAKLMERYPDLKIELRDADSEQVVEALLEGQADLGIASGIRMMNQIRQRRLYSDRFGLILRKDHPLAVAEEAPTIETAIKAGLIQNALSQRIDNPMFQAVAAETKLMAHNTVTLFSLVRAGVGVSILPQSVAHILPTELTFRPVSDLRVDRQITIYVRERSPFLQLIEEFEALIFDSIS